MILSVICVIFSLSGCLLFAKTPEPTDEDVNALKNPSFENPIREESILHNYVKEDGFVIDGGLDETLWRDSTTVWDYDHSLSTTETPIKMRTRSYYGKNGVYFSFSATDSAIYYSANRTASRNTSVELYIARSDVSEWDGNCLRISVVPNSNNSCITELWTYRPKTGNFTEDKTEFLEASWRRWQQPHLADCKIRGVGGINTNNNEGYDIEIFIPYSSLGLEKMPKAMQYMTGFNHVETAADESVRVWSGSHVGATVYRLGTWLFATNDKVGLFSEIVNEIDKDLTINGNVNLDGYLNEDLWNTNQKYTHKATKSSEGIDATLTHKTYFADEGLYLATEVKTRNVFASNKRDVKYNTGLELWIQDSKQTKMNANSVHLRVDALGNVMKFKTNEIGEFVQCHFVSKSAVQLYGCAEDCGIIASSTADGFSVETFIPWESLGINDRPNEIAIFPQYVQALDTTTMDNSASSSTFQFFALSSQTKAKTDSQKGFIIFYDKIPTTDIIFNGIVDDNDNYTGSYTFTVLDPIGKEQKGTVYVKDLGTGAAIAVVMDSEYINFSSKTVDYVPATGNNGGGIEIMMAGKGLSYDANGVYWRLFADGSSRSIRGLGENVYPASERSYMPVGSNPLYATGVKAIDVNNLTKGYNQLTVEFYIPYASVGATSADDFYFTIALNGTGAAPANGTLNNVWQNGSMLTQNPSADAWKSISSIG